MINGTTHTIVLFALILCASGISAQPRSGGDESSQGAPQSVGRKAPGVISTLLDTDAHRVALSREVKGERGVDGNLDILKMCRDAGIICGVEFNAKIQRMLRGFKPKHYTLKSLLTGVLRNEVHIVWAKPEYVGEERSGVRVLTVNPKGLPTRLDKFVDWNVALSSRFRARCCGRPSKDETEPSREYRPG